MWLEKSTIQCEDKTYPIVSVHFTEEEKARHNDLWLPSYITFGTSCMAGDWNEDSSKWTAEENKADSQIDYYLGSGDVEAYCEGGVSDGLMKILLARIVLEWF